jgi:hypothetical protein
MDNAIRPPQRTPRLMLAQGLNFARRIFGGDRFENLYRAVATEIVGLRIEEVSLLDYGCGNMSFSLRLWREGIAKQFTGMDTYSKPDLPDDPKWDHYRQISTTEIARISERFDIAIVLDVLHHAPESEQAFILRDLGLVSRYVLVKDHLEYGFVSRQLLRLADWYGNYAYGVAIPKRYFNTSRWDNIVLAAGLREIRRIPTVRVHNGLFGLVIRPRNHFISILRREETQ